MGLCDQYGGIPSGIQRSLLEKLTRRKCFISYHHADELEVQAFIERFDHQHNRFIARGIGASMPGDITSSNDSGYIMGRIRQEYLKDSTVTLLMLGNCTWARKYCDWELKTTLRSGDVYTPNGLLGIELQSFSCSQYPQRLNDNLLPLNRGAIGFADCYARVINYPQNEAELTLWIEDAFQARMARRHLIRNRADRFTYNRHCGGLILGST